MAAARVPRPRILIVEDNDERHRFFTAEIPDTFKLVIVTGAGTAKGVLQRAGTYDYAGVMPDHDLVERCKTRDDDCRPVTSSTASSRSYRRKCRYSFIP